MFLWTFQDFDFRKSDIVETNHKLFVVFLTIILDLVLWKRSYGQFDLMFTSQIPLFQESTVLQIIVYLQSSIMSKGSPSPVRLCRSCLQRFGDLKKNTPWMFGTCILLILLLWNHRWGIIALEASGKHLEASSRHPGGTQQAPRRHPGDTQGSRSVSDTKSCTFLSKNTKVALKYKFHEMFLRVGITKYCKLQCKMLPGSATGKANTAEAAATQPLENPPEPLQCKHCLGNIGKITNSPNRQHFDLLHTALGRL